VKGVIVLSLYEEGVLAKKVVFTAMEEIGNLGFQKLNFVSSAICC